jgi:NAD(P)H-hydrate epimerase
MMVLSAEQIRLWDAFTISDQHITSLELMERAVSRCMEWLGANNLLHRTFAIYCGKGNNGADGLVLGRMLQAQNRAVSVFILENGKPGTPEFEANLRRLIESGTHPTQLSITDAIPPVPKNVLVIDAVFGSGLNRPPDDLSKLVIDHLNACGNEVISIDMPSGMFADNSSKGNAIIHASHTLTFQTYKLAFLVAENEPFFGSIHLLDIGLSGAYLDGLDSVRELTDLQIIQPIYRPRKSFAHKGTYGHALMVAGSYGKIGAAVLASKACLRTGVGLLTCYIPRCGYDIVQGSVPEAMAITDPGPDYITNMDIDQSKFTVLGIGPGLGTHASTAEALQSLFTRLKYPVVLDADALNIIAENKTLFQKIPPFSILTPHPKEFDRLFGESSNDFDRLEMAAKKATELNVVIVLKGHHTFISMPGGQGYFNSTGNAGMATGGSGDVLTGIITSLVAQKYPPGYAALLGVYLHGLAGDLAAGYKSQEALTASDIIDYIGPGFLHLNRD